MGTTISGLCAASDAFMQAAIGCAVLVVFFTIVLFRIRASHGLLATCLSLFGALSIAAAVSGMIHGGTWTVDCGIFNSLCPAVAKADPLSCLMLAILGVVTLTTAIYTPSYLKHSSGHFQPGFFWVCLFGFVFAMSQLVMCSDALSFLVFWEIMSITSAGLVVTDFASHKAKKASIIYLGATRISATLLLISFLWFHSHFGSWNFSDWDLAHRSCLAPAILLFLGLAVKAGLWPFHNWLPHAHGEAPAPVSALMSGVMVKMAIYAMIRIFLVGSAPVVIIGALALGLGTVSALWGILFAVLERDLKRILACSTIENVGLIVLAVGTSILAKAWGMYPIYELAFVAALFHMLNHAMYKPLLFQTAGSVVASAGSRDLSHLGGLSHSMPRTTVLFIVAACCVCAIPPFNGFASKWTIYQSLFQMALCATPVQRAFALPIVAILSAVGALSVGAFVRVIGLGFLGRARSHHTATAQDPPSISIFVQVLLALGCVAAGLFPPLIFNALRPIVELGHMPVVISRADAPHTSPIFILLAAIICSACAVAFMRAKPNVRTYSVWECGFGSLPPRGTITGGSFSRSFTGIFGPIIAYKTTSDIKGRDKRHFPELIKVEEEMKPPVETYLYAPFVGAVAYLSKALTSLQTASIHVHLMYVFGSMLLLLVLGRLF